MFVDASALVAILTEEPQAGDMVEALKREESHCTSAIAIWETTVRIADKSSLSAADAREQVLDFLKATNIEVVHIGQNESVLAVDAWNRFGKGRHPAKLNLGDCFAYACAKAHGVELLYVGNDFSQTDVNG